MFVGSVSDNFDERIEQKIFHAEIVVDNEKDNMKQVIEANYRQVKADVVQIVESEMERIKNDPDLQHLVQAHQV